MATSTVISTILIGLLSTINLQASVLVPLYLVSKYHEPPSKLDPRVFLAIPESIERMLLRSRSVVSKP